MAELDDAIRLATKVLDRVSADPDDDLAMLARQFLRSRELITELREASYDYAHLIHVENFPTYDMAASRAYERLRVALNSPVGLTTKPRLVANN